MIEFRDFTFQYDSQAEPTLKKINLTINQGEKILIMGPSGSGKSTLGKCLNGIIPQNEKGTFTGSLMINGKTLANHQFMIFLLMSVRYCKIQIVSLSA